MPHDNLDITQRAEENFYDSLDLEDFKNEDSDVIYSHLMNKMKIVPFGDYLMRYIYYKAGFEEDFSDVDFDEYRSIIVSGFRENNTPPSFKPTSAKISTLAKNWLTQNTVNRNVVFLLGFGLNMSAQDVSDFLRKAIGERDFDYKNPFEIICLYCFENHLKYPDFHALYEEYLALPDECDSSFMLDKTSVVKNRFVEINDRTSLMERLAQIKCSAAFKRVSVTAKNWYDYLYKKVCEIIADNFNSDAEESSSGSAKRRVYTADDITESDVEKFLYSGVPLDEKGNLLKYSKSTLCEAFDSRRMSRQHLHEINTGKCDVDRFDLITLNFIVLSQDESITNNQRRFSEFVDSTNAILTDCSMGEIYIANPYECFLMMCTLSDCPLATYTDVFEKSYLPEIQ